MKRYKILDWYVHQGHQRELFKAQHDFYLVAPNGSVPVWNTEHRPLTDNVKLISEKQALDLDFDIVIIRTPIPYQTYKKFIAKGSSAIAVIQTTDPVWLPAEVRNVVWNSRTAMQLKLGFYKNRNQYHIVHGFDPQEFRQIDIEKNDRVLTVANHFKKRENIMGFDTWKFIKDNVSECDVIGSKNEEIDGAIDHLESFDKLIEAYNKYSIYLNPTRFSAMPRSRAEAAMCGMPIVSTVHYDFANYFKPGVDALLSNDKSKLLEYVLMLKNSKDLREELSGRSRECAIKHFHIDKYLSRWEHVFNKAVSGIRVKR